MIVKKIHCLECDTILEADFDKKIYKASCGCKNKTTLDNEFRISKPGSVVYAIDKTKVKAQVLEDIEDLKTGEWFYLIEPEDENTPKYKKWVGKYGGSCHGFIEGMIVDFTTEEEMTFNECRTYLKTNNVQGSEGQIYHLLYPKKD